jgi:hypothetical protein
MEELLHRQLRAPRTSPALSRLRSEGTEGAPGREAGRARDDGPPPTCRRPRRRYEGPPRTLHHGRRRPPRHGCTGEQGQSSRTPAGERGRSLGSSAGGGPRWNSHARRHRLLRGGPTSPRSTFAAARELLLHRRREEVALTAPPKIYASSLAGAGVGSGVVGMGRSRGHARGGRPRAAGHPADGGGGATRWTSTSAGLAPRAAVVPRDKALSTGEAHAGVETASAAAALSSEAGSSRPARIWATPPEGVRRTGTATDADWSTMAGSPFVFVFGAAPWLCSYALSAELGALLCSCAPPAELRTSRRIQRGGGRDQPAVPVMRRRAGAGGESGTGGGAEVAGWEREGEGNRL